MRASLTKRIVLLAAGLLTGLGLAEIGVRILAPQDDLPSRREVPGGGLVLVPNVDERAESGEFTVESRPNFAGRHDVEHRRVPAAGTFRAVVLGDSFTEAVQVPLESTFCRIAEAALRPAPVEVVNLGVSGFGTAGEYQFLHAEALSWNPALVVLVFAVTNDVYNNHPGLEKKKTKPFFRVDGDRLELLPPPPPEPERPTSPALRILGRSHIARLVVRERAVREALDGADMPPDYLVFSPDPGPVWEEAWAVTEALLGAMRRDLDERGVGFEVLLLPDRLQVRDDLWARALEVWPGLRGRAWDHEAPSRRLAGICDRQGLSCTDLLPRFATAAAADPDGLWFPVDGHLDRRGHRLVAEALAERVRIRWEAERDSEPVQNPTAPASR